MEWERVWINDTLCFFHGFTLPALLADSGVRSGGLWRKAPHTE